MEELLDRSQATQSFQKAVRLYFENKPQQAIQVTGRSPVIKVQRTLVQLLEQFPDERIESVVIDGQSGCANYTGTLMIMPSQMQILFDWDCSWKAREEGFIDFLGLPNQAEAVRQFGYRCFRKFEVVDNMGNQS